jgi:hypothetical protein
MKVQISETDDDMCAPAQLAVLLVSETDTPVTQDNTINNSNQIIAAAAAGPPLVTVQFVAAMFEQVTTSLNSTLRAIENSLISKLEVIVEKAVDKAIEGKMAELVKHVAKKRGRNNEDDDNKESISSRESDNNDELYDSYEGFPGSDSSDDEKDNATPSKKSKRCD